jgi:hypothetical protein
VNLELHGSWLIGATVPISAASRAVFLADIEVCSAWAFKPYCFSFTTRERIRFDNDYGSHIAERTNRGISSHGRAELCFHHRAKRDPDQAALGAISREIQRCGPS